MLDPAAIRDLVRPLAEGALKPAAVRDVQVTVFADAQGDEALQVIVVADAVKDATVDARAEASVEVQHALQAMGESRHAYIRFAEPAWLEDEGDDE